MPQIAPLQDALRRAAESDAACAAVWAGMLERRAANVLLLAQDLRTTGELRADLTDQEVADIVGSTNAVEYYLLLARRGWTPERYARLLADLWSRTLLEPGSPVAPTAPPGLTTAVADRAAPGGGWRSAVRGMGRWLDRPTRSTSEEPSWHVLPSPAGAASSAAPSSPTWPRTGTTC